MNVFIEVWHRILPLTSEAYEEFARYYGDSVVNANPELLDVVGGWRFTSGLSNTDVALYRYPSMAAIEQAMTSFGSDPEYVRTTEELFSRIDIEETRSISFSLPFSDDERIERIARGEPTTPRRYVRIVRQPHVTDPVGSFELLGQAVDAREKSGPERLVVATRNVVGDVRKCTELWVLPEGQTELDREPPGVDAGLLRELDARVPEVECAGLEPLAYSRLR